MKTAVAPAATILTSDQVGWDDERRAWNLAVDQRPAAIARPGSAAEVIAAVEFARRHGLRIAAQGTGHNAAPLGSLADTLLVKTTAMQQVSIDPGTRTGLVAAGALWQPVADAAGAYGLAALAGSSPNVGVVGYTVGGGMGWLSRTYGLSANNVESIELVTADGTLVHADGCREPDLFWALRGGGGSFGIVTGLEIRLFPVASVYAGLLWWPAETAAEVLHSWRQLTQTAIPDELTTCARLMRFPLAADVPAPLRGRSFVVIDVIHLGPADEADVLLRPLRGLAPVADTIQLMPTSALGHLHMDPEHPVPSVGDGLTLGALPPEAIDKATGVFNAAAGSALLAIELRHVGGEMRRARPQNGALAAVDADYALYAVGPAPTAAAASAARCGVTAVTSELARWAAPQMYLNLADTSRDPASFWSAAAYDRLRCIKAAVDPHNLIRSNHPIPPAGS
ncbi:MAG: FAD-binding protein [Streptosporangiaceae bacterium]